MRLMLAVDTTIIWDRGTFTRTKENLPLFAGNQKLIFQRSKNYEINGF